MQLFAIAIASSFVLSGLLLGHATYKVVKARNWAPAMLGAILTGILVAGAVGLLLLIL